MSEEKNPYEAPREDGNIEPLQPKGPRPHYGMMVWFGCFWLMLAFGFYAWAIDGHRSPIEKLILLGAAGAIVLYLFLVAFFCIRRIIRFGFWR